MRYTRRNSFTTTTINTNTLLSAPFYNRYRINRLVSRLAAQQARDERLRRRYAYVSSWKRCLSAFVTLSLFFVICDPIGKGYYSLYFVFLFTLFSIISLAAEWYKNHKNFIRKRLKKNKGR